MAHRTTVLLTEDAQRAAREVAAALEITPSEALRRAIVILRDQMRGVPHEERRRRAAALRRAERLFEGNDAASEVAALKEQDRWL
jgi:hypothetical protein